jgi:hypothetical protein
MSKFEMKDGILEFKFKHLSPPNTAECLIMNISYESYETGEKYYQVYNTKCIWNLHKMFQLDVTMIENIVKNNKFVLTTHSELIELEYEFEVFKKKYNFTIKIKKSRDDQCGVEHCKCSNNSNQIRMLKFKLKRANQMSNSMFNVTKHIMDSKMKTVSATIRLGGTTTIAESAGTDITSVLSYSQNRDIFISMLNHIPFDRIAVPLALNVMNSISFTVNGGYGGSYAVVDKFNFLMELLPFIENADLSNGVSADIIQKLLLPLCIFKETPSYEQGKVKPIRDLIPKLTSKAVIDKLKLELSLDPTSIFKHYIDAGLDMNDISHESGKTNLEYITDNIRNRKQSNPNHQISSYETRKIEICKRFTP